MLNRQYIWKKFKHLYTSTKLNSINCFSFKNQCKIFWFSSMQDILIFKRQTISKKLNEILLVRYTIGMCFYIFFFSFWSSWHNDLIYLLVYMYKIPNEARSGAKGSGRGSCIRLMQVLPQSLYRETKMLCMKTINFLTPW